MTSQQNYNYIKSYFDIIFGCLLLFNKNLVEKLINTLDLGFTPAEMISILKETLYKLSDKITDDEMRKMNYEVAVNK